MLILTKHSHQIELTRPRANGNNPIFNKLWNIKRFNAPSTERRGKSIHNVMKVKFSFVTVLISFCQ